ncbi:quinolinate synthase NadA [Mucisphaera calidilacus]|uniref:Quinolinate synthase n=1 Tax=Mucisphaera calidilacus TaxID=2527982 RepID=A0A518BV25_9BACT|nr:quinolinate synthase NadA [Mucisphaera calidilacus]QDU70811.1 Quinolinate synthase A [Mucisphaera calidilacus]
MTQLWQPPLAPKYTQASDEQLVEAINARRQELGSSVVVLGHHYQQDEVIRFADFLGDSFKLSQLAAERVTEVGAKAVIFLGVHFMAESADILTPDDVAVILPDLSAGCSMADMADHEDVVDAWDQLNDVIDDNTRVIPITYMNSTAAIKAFCGEHGGAVCTSSNARAIIEWALRGGDTPRADNEQIKVLFLPDQHLGRNTAALLGYDVHKQTCLWDPRHPEGLGGNNPKTIAQSTFLLWKGHCSVHKLFRPEHVDQIREQWSDVKVIVHPECDHAVVQKADMTGSTEKIIETIEQAEPGTRWAIGTEVHLVNRLSRQAANRGVMARILSDCQCLCTTMYRIDMPHLLYVLDELAEGRTTNRVAVEPAIKHWSLRALDRMLQITGAPPLKTSEPA